jgi:hypothetical protein
VGFRDQKAVGDELEGDSAFEPGIKRLIEDRQKHDVLEQKAQEL